MLFYIEKCEMMEKLLELLLEYKPQIHYLDRPKGVYDKKYGIGWYKREGDIGGWFSEEVIISKKFGFIEWLVDNDKINLDKIDKKIRIYDYVEEYEEYEYVFPDVYESLLMLLSVSDTPIEDLISYLK